MCRMGGYIGRADFELMMSARNNMIRFPNDPDKYLPDYKQLETEERQVVSGCVEAMREGFCRTVDVVEIRLV